MSLFAFALAYSGLTALCFAMERHHRTVFGRSRSRRTAVALRVVGFALLAASVLPSVTSQPGTGGYVAWFGFVTAAGLALVFLLPYAPRAAALLAVAGPFAAAFLSAL